MAVGNTKKRGTGGLVSSAPISSTKALRSLEKAYATQGAELDAALARIKELEKQKGKK